MKWQLEDLAFAVLLPEALRRDRADGRARRRPSARSYLDAGRSTDVRAAPRRAARSRPTSRGRPKHYWSIYEKMVVRGKEFDEINDLVGVRVDRRVGEGLLRRARLDPRDVAAGAGPVQGLHRDAQVQPLPVVAHDGGRAAGQGGRGPDPHAARCTGGPSTASPRTGATRSSAARPRTSSWLQRIVDWQQETTDPGEFMAEPEDRPRAGRGLRLHAQGQGHHAADRRHAGRLRVRDPHRGRPPLHRRAGQRPAGAARLRARRRATPCEIFTSKVEGAGPSRDWLQFVAHAAGPHEDPPVVLA